MKDLNFKAQLHILHIQGCISQILNSHKQCQIFIKTHQFNRNPGIVIMFPIHFYYL